nr:creatininase family protein [bacterium]
MQKVHWLDLFPEEFETAFARCPVVYMGYGSAEPHGAANALGTDFYRAQGVLARTAREVGGIVAPPIAWHVLEAPENDWEGQINSMGMPLSTSISPRLFLKNFLYALRAFDARGFHVAVMMSAHSVYGLSGDMRLLAEGYRSITGSPMRTLIGYSRELCSSPALAMPHLRRDHGGEDETAELMYLRPGSADPGRAAMPIAIDAQAAGGNDRRGPYCAPKDFMQRGENPTYALGREIILSQVQKLGEKIRRELEAYVPVPGYRAPTLAQTEGLWARFETLTRGGWQGNPNRYEREHGNQALPVEAWDEGDMP